ncbi:MAG: hypothetical protein K8J09_03740, partial [Planctomycetes bacterium]|nr:hypothetical protein [Planctomycetota bacterium]
MNCSTCRFELSQCLDGRLASGRRAIVLQHAETCAACGAFWKELQAAQRLTLQLQHPKVGDDFRDGLWARIRAGEGTPEGVFHDGVPLLTKLRYGLTGAAAAAVALLFVTWSRSPVEPARHQDVANIEASGSNAHEERAVPAMPVSSGGLPVDQSPMISATQPLTFNLVAIETAKQLEQRYLTASFAVQQLESGDNGAAVVRQALDNANELHAFGQVLLDLRDHQRLFFQSNEADAELRFAVNMLAQCRREQRNEQTVRRIVAPALRSKLLGNLARVITVRPALDQREDQDVLLQLNLTRPDIFQKLFFVFGPDEVGGHDLTLIRSGR